MRLLGFLLAFALCTFPGSLRAQLPETADSLPADSAGLRARAEEIQAAFESYREQRIPPAMAGAPTGCDEMVGRFCLHQGAGDDDPVPAEPPEVSLARTRTIRELARIGERIPGDGWILGQRVFYLTEAGNARGAEELARRCEAASPWWCGALTGYVLHHEGEFVRADSAFRSALAQAPDSVRTWYRTPEYLFGSDGRKLFEDASPADHRELWSRLWLLSDPLYLVDGNDRLTAHLARKTLVRIRRGSATAYGVPFDTDLEELTVRYGGEVGYERTMRPPSFGPGAGLQDTREVIGRQHRYEREYLPTGAFLADPAAIPPGAWTLDEWKPRTGYTAPYALDVSPLEAQVARFRRGDSLLVVASYRAGGEPDTPRRASAPPRRPPPAARRPPARPSNPFLPQRPSGPPDAGDGAEASATRSDAAPSLPTGPVESGLFLLGWDGTPALDQREKDPTSVVTARVPDGAYVFGLEVLQPDGKRAWRTRQGLRLDTLAAGQSAVSDLLFLKKEDELPRSLDEALSRVLPSIRVRKGQTFTVAWEVYQLRPGESARVTLGFTKGEPSLLERIGQFLRVVQPEEPIQIRFQDRAPDRLGTVFRALNVQVPDFDPGVYTLNLEVTLPGRTPMVTSRRLTIEE